MTLLNPRQLQLMRDEQLQEWFKAYAEGTASVSFGYDWVKVRVINTVGFVVYETGKGESHEGSTIAVANESEDGSIADFVVKPLRQLATFFNCQITVAEGGDPHMVSLIIFTELPGNRRWVNMVLIGLVLMLFDRCPFIQGLRPLDTLPE